MSHSVVVVTPPAALPVDPQEVLSYLHHDVPEDFPHALQLVEAERQRCERVTGLTLITTTFRLTMAGWYDLPMAWVDGDVILLPGPPLLAISAVSYVDATGTTQALAGSQWQVDTAARPGRFAPAYGVTWPTTRDQFGAVQVTFSAGFGTGPASVPEAIKGRIRQNVGYLLQNREQADERILDGNYAALGYGSYP